MLVYMKDYLGATMTRTSGLLINTDGTYQNVSISSSTDFATTIACEHIDCVTFAIPSASESIAVWVDDEGAFTHEANVLGTIIIKEICDAEADEYFTQQHVLYGPLLITTGNEGDEDWTLAESMKSTIIAKLETYLNADL